VDGAQWYREIKKEKQRDPWFAYQPGEAFKNMGQI